MIRALAIGVGISIIGIVISYATKDWARVMYILGTLGLCIVLASAILSGSLVSGDRIRANYTNSSEDEHKRKQKWSLTLFLIGFPSLLTMILYYMAKPY